MKYMKKVVSAFLACFLTLALSSCNQATQTPSDIEPDVSQMRAICELSVMDCYYHNVAKFKEENAEGILWWQKDKQFWIEYSGIVTLGVDISSVDIQINDTQITIHLPEAEVLNCKVDSASLTEDSFIVAKNSAAITAEDEIAAFDAAQSQLEQTASEDKVLLATAQQRTRVLLEEYIENLSNAIGKEYTIEWEYTNADAQSDSSGTATDGSIESDVNSETAPSSVTSSIES